MKRLSSPSLMMAAFLVCVLLLAGCTTKPYGGGGGGDDGYVTVTLTGATGSDLSSAQSAVIQSLPLDSVQVDLQPATTLR